MLDAILGKMTANAGVGHTDFLNLRTGLDKWVSLTPAQRMVVTNRYNELVEAGAIVSPQEKEPPRDIPSMVGPLPKRPPRVR
jgi:hypothetical protein